MNKNQTAALTQKIDAYVASAIADSWKGSVENDEEYESLVADLAIAKNELFDYIDKLTEV